jgi:Flp pilus assembly protein TadB
MATRPPREPATPDAAGITSTPQSFVSPDYSFTLQMVMELQKSTGQLTEAVNSLRDAIDKQGDKIDKIEDKLSGITQKIYAAGVVLTILVVIGGFIVNKAWDIVVQQLTSRPSVIAPTQPTTPSATR